MNRRLLSVAVGLIGLSLVWVAASPLVALGAFLMLWAHNLERHHGN